MTTPELLKPPRTEPVARAEIAASDRRSWFPGTRALGSHGILSRQNEREVARFDSRVDRDMVVAMARSWDDMKASLEALVTASLEGHPADASDDWIYDELGSSVGTAVLNARAALLKASAVRP